MEWSLGVKWSLEWSSDFGVKSLFCICLMTN